MPSFLSATIGARNTLKALAMGTKSPSKDNGVTPLDCIFACSICGDVFSDVYQQRETVHGLSDGINSKERIVTRLYVTSCCHVICIKHIDGGNGPAFHQAGQQPQAPCPVCVKETGDNTARQLFSVRGFGEDEHDPAIPQCWFKAPPMKLEGRDKEMEALRFQYLALIRFSKNIATSCKQATKSRAEIEAKLQNVQDLAARERQKVEALQQELERLAPLEEKAQKLQRLEAKMPATRHYLNLIPKLVEQNTRMQQRLAALGFAMSVEPLPNFGEPIPFEEGNEYDEHNANEELNYSRKTGSSHTIGRSAYTPGEDLNEGGSASARRQRPFKRSRLDSPAGPNNIHAAGPSREMMPPPFKPLSKMRSIRKLIPSFRNRFVGGRSPEAPVYKSSGLDVHMYENGQWEVTDGSSKSHDIEDQSQKGHVRVEAPCMTGALPIEAGPVNPAGDSQLLSGLGIHNNNSEFTFESPSGLKVPQQQRGKLPTDPSYIRLLDGLGRHTGLELKLDDPRQRRHDNDALIDRTNGHIHRLDSDRIAQQETRPILSRVETQDNTNRWSYGHAFLQQSPVNGNMPSAPDRFDRDRGRNNETLMNSQRQSMINPMTPAPARFQQPADTADHVVSPFFGSSSHRSRPFSRSQFTEHDISSSRLATYPSRHRQPALETDWREPRSLNGLSFFESPVNDRNERIAGRRNLQAQDFITPLPQYRARNVDSRGFLVRPDSTLPIVGRHRAHEYLVRSPSRPVQSQTYPQMSFPSPTRLSQSQVPRLPSAMPPMLIGSSPRRGQAENLGLPGVRSSCYSQTRGISGRPARPMQSSTRRRVVRR